MKIAILGAATMGRILAERFLEAGHDVLVYNEIVANTRTLMEMGASMAMSPTEAINSADASIIVMQDSTQMKKLLLENTDRRAYDGKPLLNGTITDPDEMTEIALVIRENGGRFSAMSITSGPDQIENKLNDFIIGSNMEEQQFWTDLFIQALPDPMQSERGDAVK